MRLLFHLSLLYVAFLNFFLSSISYCLAQNCRLFLFLWYRLYVYYQKNWELTLGLDDNVKPFYLYMHLNFLFLSAWNTLWPQERKRQRAFFLFGLALILQLDIEGIRTFFRTFFCLPDWYGLFCLMYLIDFLEFAF